MRECPPGYHNRMSARYDGRLEITEQGDGYHMEQCSVCKRRWVQVYAWDAGNIEVPKVTENNERDNEKHWNRRAIWMA